MPVDYSVIQLAGVFVAIAIIAGALLVIGRGGTKEQAVDDMQSHLSDYGEEFYLGNEVKPGDGSQAQVTVDTYDVY